MESQVGEERRLSLCGDELLALAVRQGDKSVEVSRLSAAETNDSLASQRQGCSEASKNAAQDFVER